MVYTSQRKAETEDVGSDPVDRSFLFFLVPLRRRGPRNLLLRLIHMKSVPEIRQRPIPELADFTFQLAIAEDVQVFRHTQDVVLVGVTLDGTRPVERLEQLELLRRVHGENRQNLSG